MCTISTSGITQFRGQYAFLSNFHPVLIMYENIVYPTLEHAYQAVKTTDGDVRLIISNLQHPRESKRYGRRINLRDDWDDIKLNIMLELLRLKFKPGTILETMLVNTYPLLLVEGNMWHDNFWGSCACLKCKGVYKGNMLGKLLMQVRDELRSTSSENHRS